jgi:hypothetical protein
MKKIKPYVFIGIGVFIILFAAFFVRDVHEVQVRYPMFISVAIFGVLSILWGWMAYEDNNKESSHKK